MGGGGGGGGRDTNTFKVVLTQPELEVSAMPIA